MSEELRTNSGPKGLSNETYEEICLALGRDPIEPRIKSITFAAPNHRSWTATVGEEMCGWVNPGGKLNGRRVSRQERIYARHRVLAIIGPAPYLVVTSGQPLGPDVSEWENPFTVGAARVSETTYFA